MNERVLRRRLQKTFDAWLNKVQSRLPIALEVTNRTHRGLQGKFVGITSSIIFFVSWEIVIAAEIEGECWDLLAAFDAWPKATKEGTYTCSLLAVDGQHKIFATPEDLWAQQIFKPFEQWITSVLLPAEWLAFYGIDRSITWAKLHREPPDDRCDLAYCIPVKVVEILR